MVRIESEDSKFEFVISKDTKTLIRIDYKGDGIVGEITIPHSINDEVVIEQIGASIFKEFTIDEAEPNKAIPLAINFEHGIKKVSPYVFYGCERILDIAWSDTCYEIPASLFASKNVLKLTRIDNVREIHSKAFINSIIGFLEWPKSCKEIPEGCFEGARIIGKLSGMEFVETVEHGAFARSSIKELCWPDKCSTIPVSCFNRSEITEIYGLENVKTIKTGAFKNSKIKSLDLSKTKVETIEAEAFAYCQHLDSVAWPSTCSTIPQFCFTSSKVRRFNGFEHVTTIKQGAFWDSDLEGADLSGSPVVVIEKGAFPHHLQDKGAVIMPYYNDAVDKNEIFNL